MKRNRIRVINVAAHKGGVTKSTTSFVLANLYSTNSHKAITRYDHVRTAKKTLVIDMDFQRNVSMALLKEQYDEAKGGIVEAIVEGDATNYIIQSSENSNLYVLPATKKISNFDRLFYTVLSSKENAHLMLKNALEKAIYALDIEVVIIDNSPNLNQLVFQGMNVVFDNGTTDVLIPLQMDANAKTSLEDIFETIESVRETQNTSLQVEKILPVLIDTKSKEDQAELEEVREGLEDLVSDAIITSKVMMKSIFRNGFSEQYKKNRDALKMYYELFHELENEEIKGDGLND